MPPHRYNLAAIATSCPLDISTLHDGTAVICFDLNMRDTRQNVQIIPIIQIDTCTFKLSAFDRKYQTLTCVDHIMNHVYIDTIFLH